MSESMDESILTMHAPAAPTDTSVDLIVRSALVAISTFGFITLHELAHLVVGRLGGIPAVFTSLTSAGIPSGTDASRYGALQLALMNGIAPLLTVIIGFAAFHLLARQRMTLKPGRYFFAWWAIFGIPYLGLQMMLIIQHVDYSGNGADSAAVAGYLHLSMPIRAFICGVGFLYYLASAAWVLGVIRTGSKESRGGDPGTGIAFWRYVPAVLLMITAIAGMTSYIANEAHGLNPGFGFGGAFIAWAAAAAILTAWKNPAVTSIAKRWLLPGIIGMLALIPLSLISTDGNDYASIWLPILPPIFAAAMLASRRISAN